MGLTKLSRFDPRSRLQDRSTKLYFAVGGLSLAKAVLLREDGRRFRRELRDAALFLGAGLLLREGQRRWAPNDTAGERAAGTEDVDVTADADGGADADGDPSTTIDPDEADDASDGATARRSLALW